MCTLILLSRPGHAWPLLVAANRDEMLDRPWLAPAAHWPDQPDVVGGLDRLAGGTWLGVNGAGLVAGVLNRAHSLGQAAGRRSRGELPLMALRESGAAAAAGRLGQLAGGLYRGFNLVVADAAGAYFLRGAGDGTVQSQRLAPGLHMVTASDPDDLDHPRVSRHLPKFALAPAPMPPDWGSWPALLADHGGPWEAALTVPARQGFGTASSSLIGLGPPGAGQARQFLFAPGPPSAAPFAPGLPSAAPFAAVAWPGAPRA